MGAIVGLLTAPSSGRETRRKLAREIGDQKEALLRSGQRAASGAASYLRASLRRVSRPDDGAVRRPTMAPIAPPASAMLRYFRLRDMTLDLL